MLLTSKVNMTTFFGMIKNIEKFDRENLEKLDKSELIDIILYLVKEIEELKALMGYP